MADVMKYKSVKGSFRLEGLEGSMGFEFEGSRPPNDLKDLPAYVGECIKRVVLGASDAEVSDLKKRIADLEKQVDKKIAEINDLRQVVKSPTKAAH
jgi:hypothetical protein